MNHHVLIRCAIFALFWPLVAPVHASGSREVGAVEGWSIIHDPAGDGACYAKGEYGKETRLTLGKIAPRATWSAVVSNAALEKIEVGAPYEIRFVFGTKYVWSEKAIGTQDGLRSDDIGEEFVDDFARASSVKLFIQDQSIDSFKLRGTRDAVAAINQCYVTYTRRAAPYAPSESTEALQSP